MDWARILAYVTGTVDQELLARNESSEARSARSVIAWAARFSPTSRP